MPPTAPSAPSTATAAAAVVIGAGPAGLYLTFQLGLHGIQAHVIDALPQPGGQCAQLFADKPIYDIPAHHGISGGDLSAQLFAQADLFQPHWHWQQLVQGLERVQTPEPDAPLPEQWLVTSDSGQQWVTPLVFLAAGIGAFLPRKLNLPGLDALDASHGLHYHPLPLHAPNALAAWAGQAIVVHGGTDQAVAHALDLAHAAAKLPNAPRITLHHRRDVLTIHDDLQTQLQQALHNGLLGFVAGPLQNVERDAQGHLTGLHLLQANGQPQLLPAQTVVVLQGLQPQLGPIAQWGLPLQRKLLPVDPLTLQPLADPSDPATPSTPWPGLYAVGDIVHYPGKRKLMVSGFHEATQAAYAAMEWQRGAPMPTLTYTSSDTALHALIAQRTQK
ncbi:NAD(P)/FAD-dependent oxidoreductase [Curvibacter sp. CHRR-16]|nr:NAD(P)/FAD-dependent oxidoreductase [Curvibacter sp. CHRR-16]MBT0571013.1 NAD(P)/FAD-dependent oxidoreductase [Curvibacter sp. CHRR-16]